MHTEKLERFAGIYCKYINDLFQMETSQFVFVFPVCLQDASPPGPSPSTAGVLVPPKVASITSELLAHAKVQLPLNM